MTLRHPVVCVLLLVSAVAGTQCAGRRIAAPAVDPSMASAQALGQVRGRVFDEYGASIPDAAVVFEPVDPKSNQTTFGATADARGRFDFEAVPAGAYRVTCRALGYQTSQVVHEVRPGVQTEVTMTMRAVK